jgi:hypothetical protein
MQKVAMMNDQPNDNRVIELPAIEQIRKAMFTVVDGKYKKPYASLLEKYYVKGIISEAQYHAGTRLYTDAYYGGVLSQLKAIDYTKAKEIGSTIKFDMSVNQADKHHNFSNAINNNEFGRIQKDILWHVCIFDMPLNQFSDNKMFASGLLRETLNELVRYYKK